MTAKIKYTAQRYNKDCVIACLAMILPTSYENIISNFRRDFDKTGLELEIAANYLMDCGFYTVFKECRHTPNNVVLNREMWKPFAPVHLLSVQQFVDSPVTHCIVMDNKGKIYDPGDKNSIKKHFYEVKRVLGLFPYLVPKGKK